MSLPDALHDETIVVLDSNVWIDILVFDDPAARPIRAALETGSLIAVIDARCRDELVHVLDYPQFSARQIDKTEALATLERLTRQVETAETPITPPLPRCKDRDDQKFLELAHGAHAVWLVTKDRALLKLARRTARDFGFRIETPVSFVQAALASPQPA